MSKLTDLDLAQILWDYLRYEQPLKKADIIIGLGCHDIGVAQYAASLYKQGYAPLVMFCGSAGRLTKAGVDNEADWYADEATRLGVPDEVILRERNSTNTGENIQFAYKLLQERGIKLSRAIIVHPPNALRRDYATIMKQWPGEERPEFIFSAEQVSMDEYIDRAESFEALANLMVGDLQRIIEYPKLGFQIEQDVPEATMSAYEELIARGYNKHLIS